MNDENEFKALLDKETSWQNYMENGSRNIVKHMMALDILGQIREKKDTNTLLIYATRQYTNLLEKARSETTRDGYLRLFKYLELEYHFAMSSPIFPNYVLLPPQLFLDQTKYLNEYSEFPFDPLELFEAGILPLDLDVQAELIGEFRSKQMMQKKGLIDCDYFLQIYNQDKFPNFFMGQSLLSQYEKEIDDLNTRKERILNIGSIRAHRIFSGLNDYSTQMMYPISLAVNNRTELEQIINRVKKVIEKSRLSLWMRGQPSEYQISNVKEETIHKLFKWRNVKDISLWPSLYRNIQNQLTDLPTYAHKCVDLSYYSFIMSQFLNLDSPSLLASETSDFTETSLAHFENPLTWQSIQKHEDGSETAHTKQYRPIEQSLTKSLFLQHYGIPSNILDVTSDLEVALFFAKMKIAGNTHVQNEGKGYIYLFLLDNKNDMVLDSGHLLRNTGLLRPIRQCCGLLYGASMVNRNHYARYISIRLELTGDFDVRRDQHFLFPDRSEDTFLDFMLKGYEQNNQLSMKPFQLNK
jgi:hypothetical protein